MAKIAEQRRLRKEKEEADIRAELARKRNK